MNSVVARFRKRKNPDCVYEIKWPVDKPEFVFTVARFSESERMGARTAAKKHLAECGLIPPSVDNKEATAEYEGHAFFRYFIELGKVVGKHIKGWKHTPEEGDVIKFSPGDAALIFQEMADGDLSDIGFHYHELEVGKLKKKEDAGSTAEASSKPSEPDSSTTSTPQNSPSPSTA